MWKHAAAAVLYVGAHTGVTFVVRYLAQASSHYYHWDYQDYWLLSGHEQNSDYAESDFNEINDDVNFFFTDF